MHDIDAEEIKQTIEWGGLDMEQLKHTMLGNRIYIWVHDGGTGIFIVTFSMSHEF